MVVKFYNYKVLSQMNKIRDIDMWDQSDGDFSLTLDENMIFGDGSAKYLHANNSNSGDMIYSIIPGLDISDYDYIFLWIKTNNAANFDLRLQSSSGNYNQYRLIPTIVSVTNAWKIVKVDLSSPTTTAGTFDSTNLTEVRFFSSTANHQINLNYIAFAYEIFEFETNIMSLLQGIGVNTTASNTNLPILGKNGGISVNQGSEDIEFDLPCFLKGNTAFQKKLDLNVILNLGQPILFELENYAFYPIMIDNINQDDISKETEESSDLTHFDLSLQVHIYNN